MKLRFSSIYRVIRLIARGLPEKARGLPEKLSKSFNAQIANHGSIGKFAVGATRNVCRDVWQRTRCLIRKKIEVMSLQRFTNHRALMNESADRGDAVAMAVFGPCKAH
jgi:hypothetical protein